MPLGSALAKRTLRDSGQRLNRICLHACPQPCAFHVQYSEAMDDVMNVVASLAEAHGSELQAQHSAQRGWHCTMPWAGTIAELDPAFLQPGIKKRAKKTALVQFTTVDLRRLNSRLTETLDEIFLMTDNIIKKSLAQVISSSCDSIGPCRCTYKV